MRDGGRGGWQKNENRMGQNRVGGGGALAWCTPFEVVIPGTAGVFPTISHNSPQPLLTIANFSTVPLLFSPDCPQWPKQLRRGRAASSSTTSTEGIDTVEPRAPRMDVTNERNHRICSSRSHLRDRLTPSGRGIWSKYFCPSGLAELISRNSDRCAHPKIPTGTLTQPLCRLMPAPPPPV